MNAEELVTQVETLGIILVADGPWLRIRPKSLLTPELLEKLWTHKAEILELLTLRGWSTESLDTKPAPVIKREVATPDGNGQLVVVMPEFLGVLLNRDKRRVRHFLPDDLRPLDDGPPVVSNFKARLH